MFRQQLLEVSVNGRNLIVGNLFFRPETRSLFHGLDSIIDLEDGSTAFLKGSFAYGEDSLLLYITVANNKTGQAKHYVFNSAEWYLVDSHNKMNTPYILEPTNLTIEDFSELIVSVVEDGKRNF
ncbi:hypothetical protein ACQUY5_29300 [Bacillus cereus]|uniref:hypothetical protein n=1 Tax=Bacillus cereus TaxID=1396 RepID=UPI003D1727CA